MTFTHEEAEKIKEQLLVQIENSQIENKEQIKEHVEVLDEQSLEEFLKQNNIEFEDGELKQEGSEKESRDEPKNSKCIFCSIVSKKIPSYVINENKKAMGLLEINPLSKGHSIVLPKEHLSTEQLPKSVLGLAQKIAKKIKNKLKPDDVKIETSSLMDHAMVNIIPLYRDKKLNKYKAEETELMQIKSILETKKRSQRKKKTKEKTSASDSSDKLPRISFRIP